MSAPERVVQAGEVRLARVESLRALAALAVMVAHLWGSAHLYAGDQTEGTVWRRLIFGGGFGVFVFYTLSGYLLFSPFVRQRFGRGEPVTLRQYALNRALRILPLYYVAVVFLLLVQNEGGTLNLWWRHLLFAQATSYSSLNTVDGSLWSVSVEIQFYALLPLLAAGLAWAARGSRARAAVLVLAAGIGSAILRRHLAPHSGQLWNYQLPTTFLYFSTGMAMALLRDAWAQRRPSLLDGPLGSSTLWAMASVPVWAAVIWDYRRVELCAGASFLVLGALVLPLRGGRLVAALDWRPLALLGVASYSLYVWHVPIIDALDGGRGFPGRSFVVAFVVICALCIAVAFLSYRLFEAPALRLRRQWARGAARQREDRGTTSIEPASLGSRP